VTVHGTNNLRIENNVTYNTVGHCFFLEDGIETGNQYVRNLAIQTKCHPTKPCVPTNLAANGDIDNANRQEMRKISFSGKDTLLPSDNTAASFWITNPNNSYIDNVAAGSDENGFWLSLPEHPNGAFLGTDVAKATWPRRTKLGEFRGNVAHSNFDGFMFDRNINENNTFGLTGNSHMPKEDPADPNSKSLVSNFDNLTAYKNRNGGIWGRGENHVFRNTKLADNAIGFTHASGSAGRDPYTSLVVDSLFVGETDNVGNPVTPEEKAYGRSLPKRKIPDFPIRGYEYYDYRHDVVDTTFVNYRDNAQRRAGALSWLLYTSSGVTTTNTMKGARFVDAKPVDFPKYDQRFDNDNRGGVAWRTAVIHDLDGSIGGVRNSYILLHDGEHDSVATDETCKIQPTWNAAVCAGDVGRLFMNKPGGTLRDLSAGSPVVLRRNGKDHRITGNQSNVRSGTEMRVDTDRQEVFLSLREMDQGAWVVFELPGFTKAASGTRQASLKALRDARETAYFKDKNSLWVKLVVSDAEFQGPVVEPVGRLVAQASLTVSR
jgi:cell migration-inducing and hyaluronan-binding protein